MFDIGFWELLLVFVLGLLVLGPERLPRVARAAGQWLARARAAVRKFQREIERELAIEDVKKLYKEQRRENPPPTPPDGAQPAEPSAPEPGPPAEASREEPSPPGASPDG